MYDEQVGGEKIRVKVTGYDFASGETILLDEVREPFADEADYLLSEQRWLGLLHEGSRKTLLKAN